MFGGCVRVCARALYSVIPVASVFIKVTWKSWGDSASWGHFSQAAWVAYVPMRPAPGMGEVFVIVRNNMSSVHASCMWESTEKYEGHEVFQDLLAPNSFSSFAEDKKMDVGWLLCSHSHLCDWGDLTHPSALWKQLKKALEHNLGGGCAHFLRL